MMVGKIDLTITGVSPKFSSLCQHQREVNLVFSNLLLLPKLHFLDIWFDASNL